MNGAAEPARGGDVNSSMENAAVRINVGFSMGQVLAGFAALGTVISAAVTAGYLFVPAKETDLRALQQIVEIVRTEQTKSRDSITRLTVAVDNLSGIVDGIRRKAEESPAQPTPRPRAEGRQRKAAPKPTSGVLGLF